MSNAKKPASPRSLKRLVMRLSVWAWRDELVLQNNVVEDASALVEALLRGESADAYCGYGRDGQASNYRDELKWSLRALKSHNAEMRDGQ